MAQVEDSEILRLTEEMKPIHQAIHQSAQTILELARTDLEQAKEMYLNETRANVDKLVVLLDQVAEITEQKMSDNQKGLSGAVTRTEVISVITVLVIIISSILLMFYVLKGIVEPIQIITESSRSLAEGKLDFQIDVDSQNEIGDLASSLNKSVKNLKVGYTLDTYTFLTIIQCDTVTVVIVTAFMYQLTHPAVLRIIHNRNLIVDKTPPS